MPAYVTSADGTRIAFDRLGDGEAVIIVGGLSCDRLTFHPLAQAVARQFSAVSYDRRGRGLSQNTEPYAVEREIEDLASVIVGVGGSASVYGHSSGAGLALRAAAAGLPIVKLMLHEPPYGPDDEQSQREAQDLAETIRRAIAEDRRSDAIRMFLAASGMPDEMSDNLSNDPKMLSLSPTMPYDFEVMGDFTGGAIPEELVSKVDTPTLVIAGGASPDFFRDTATRIAELLPNGRLAVLDGQDHAAPADVVAPVVAEFLR